MANGGGAHIYVGVIGIGGVGKHFLAQLASLSECWAKKKSNDNSAAAIRILVVALCRSTTSVLSKDYQPLHVRSWENLFSPQSAGSGSQSRSEESVKVGAALDPSELAGFLSNAPGKAILIDNSASEQVASEYPVFLKHGVSVVTANKKAFSSSQALFDQIYSIAENTFVFSDPAEHEHGHDHSANPSSTDLLPRTNAVVFHESSVGAGLPIISTLRDLLETGDELVSLQGVFSGTMSFLFNQFMPVPASSSNNRISTAGHSFSQAVMIAKQSGFTEPDPRDDLNGLDVARKLVILARLCGLKLDTNGFPVESLLPPDLDHVQPPLTAEDFLARLPEYDEAMSAKKTAAAARAQVIRYVGSLDLTTGSAKVGLESFDYSHPIAALQGSDNIVMFKTKRYGDNPLVIQGAGAGGAVTAMGVTADFIRAVRWATS